MRWQLSHWMICSLRQHGVEDLRPQPDVADRADAVARLGDGDAVAALATPARRSPARCGSSAATTRRARRAMRSSDGLQLGELGGQRLARSASTAFCSAASSASARLTAAVEVVGLEHQLEDLVFERLDLGLREARSPSGSPDIPELVLTAISLLAELRQAALVDRDVLFDRAARVLVLGEPLLGGGDALAGGLEPGFERLLALGLVGEPALGVVRRGVELLKRDQAFEVSDS